MAFTHRQQLEIFHFLFLERLLKISDPRLFVLKGGVNLRFFFASPRYSEDMDLDVMAGSVATLNKNGYRILQDPAFARSLATYGVAELRVNDPGKAKQTATTQRFRARLITTGGESYPTKVEFSRRGVEDEFTTDAVEPRVAERMRRLSFACQHYSAQSACLQKARALANRAQPQARDVFDLYVLWLGGHADGDAIRSLTPNERHRAEQNLLVLAYSDYAGQVLEYLEPEQLGRFANENRWNEVCERVLALLQGSS